MKTTLGLILAPLLAIACSEPAATTEASAPPAPAPASEPATAPPAMTASSIVDTAVAAGDFKTLVAAVQAAGLEATLRDGGPFTVFAPTDAAFAALPPGALDDLLKPENKDKLVQILTYHVVPGKVMAADVAGKTVDAATVEGKTVKVVGSADGKVTVNGANVVSPDIAASNGVIHVIDQVIMPPA
jgi:uncharacterized surface protein with fasciclin (FAS1) repeats